MMQHRLSVLIALWTKIIEFRVIHIHRGLFFHFVDVFLSLVKNMDTDSLIQNFKHIEWTLGSPPSKFANIMSFQNTVAPLPWDC